MLVYDCERLLLGRQDVIRYWDRIGHEEGEVSD